MDAMKLGFAHGVFDSFLLEFYGSQTSLSQVLALQENLAGVLSDKGMGFIVATRKKYPSFWFKMAKPYSKSMIAWLMKQSVFDYFFASTDECKESLFYGLYTRNHTIESVTAELSLNFDVIDCFYEQHDPRYVMSVVKCKKRQDKASSIDESFRYWNKGKKQLELSETSLQETLTKTEAICNLLESHEKSVSQFFEENESVKKENSILDMQTETTKFIELLTDVFEVLPTQAS